MARKICLRVSLKIRIIFSVLILLMALGGLYYLLFFGEELSYNIKEEAYFLLTDELMTLLLSIVVIAAAIYCWCVLWVNENILDVDEHQIRLRRERYTYKISFLKIKGLTLFRKGKVHWLFVLQNNNVVRPIDLSLWKEDFLAFNDVLAEIARKNNVPFVYTKDYDVVDDLFDQANPVPDSEIYQIKNSNKISILISSCLIPFLAFYIVRDIFLLINYECHYFFVRRLAAISTLFVFLIGWIVYCKSQKKISFSLQSTGFMVGDQSFDWDDFGFLSPSCACVYAKNRKMKLSTFDPNELVEQFSYFSKSYIKIR